MQAEIRTEVAAQYDVSPEMYELAEAAENAVIEHALKIITKRLRVPGAALTSPNLVRSRLRLSIGLLEHEVFRVIFLDNQHRVIEEEDMFRGTIDSATVHPREVVKRALQLNAAAVIFGHNHPSGVSEPSSADRIITNRLKDGLELVGIRVLDHMVVGGEETVSFAERGWL